MEEKTTLKRLIQAYEQAPGEFRATQYWKFYENDIFNVVDNIDFNELRSGVYPILATFGFSDVRYYYHPNLAIWKKFFLKILHRIITINKPILPYQLRVDDICEMAYRHCQMMGTVTNSMPIDEIKVSSFGNPADIFEMDDSEYTIDFLSFYIRYCFANQVISFTGDETIVELGTGSGYQIEVLKKVNPNLTILCFDLPAQIYLCQEYLKHALENVELIGTDETLSWNDLSKIRKGGVHFFGNWQFPLLKNFKFDVFWNAASFGEMELDIVENYLKYILGNARWIYLLQARHGKETTGKARVSVPIKFEDYSKLLQRYQLKEEQDAWYAHRRLSESGGYFQAVWEKI
jgi:putative sugar O-methyltransferase